MVCRLALRGGFPMFLRQWWTVGAWPQVGAGMIMIRRNASTIWSAHGQLPGSRRYRRRLLRMRWAGTCSILNRSAVDAALRKVFSWADYDLHKGIERDEDTGEDTYDEHVDRFIAEYNKAVKSL